MARRIYCGEKTCSAAISNSHCTKIPPLIFGYTAVWKVPKQGREKKIPSPKISEGSGGETKLTGRNQKKSRKTEKEQYGI